MEIKQFILIGLLLFISCDKKNESFVKVRGGYYEVGEQNNSMNPKRIVKINDFFINKYEVTNLEFQKFVNETKYQTDAERYKNCQIFDKNLPEFRWKTDSTACWKYPQGQKKGSIQNKMNHPVTCISFNDALAYCKWANVRLPLNEEWEIASRGKENKKSFIKNKKDINLYANIWMSRDHNTIDKKDIYIYTSPIGTYLPNNLGLYDIYGNVFEFCLNKPKNIIKKNNLVTARGGSWWCSEKSCDFFNSHKVGQINKSASFSNVGFRVVKNK